MRFSADMNAAPCSGFLFFAGHDDRFVGRAYSIDFGTLLHQDIVYDIVIDRYNLYSFFDVQCGACLYNVFTAQFIGVAGFQGYVFGYCTFQGTAVFYPVAFVIVAVVGVVIAASGEGQHSGCESQRIEFRFHCFHNSIVLS